MYYSYRAKTTQSFFGRLRAFLIRHELFSLVPAMPGRGKRGKILDIGCGSGETLALLQSIGWEGYGLDIDPAAIRQARRRGVKHAAVGSYKNLHRYPDGFFDAIRLYHVIEHLDDPRLCLRLARKKLKAGGEIIIGTPNIDSLVAKLMKQYWYNLDAPRHLFIFSPNTLDRLATRVKFAHPKIEFFSAGGWIGSFQYILRQWTGSSVDLINRPWLVLLLYPFEWVLDRLGAGDVFVLRARKS